MTQCPQLIRHLSFHHSTRRVTALKDPTRAAATRCARRYMSAQSGPVRSLEMRLSQWGGTRLGFLLTQTAPCVPRRKAPPRDRLTIRSFVTTC